jgi:actin-related protein
MSTQHTLVLDNGGSSCRIGWAGLDSPSIIAPNAVANQVYRNYVYNSCCANNAILNSRLHFLTLSYVILLVQRGNLDAFVADQIGLVKNQGKPNLRTHMLSLFYVIAVLMHSHDY